MVLITNLILSLMDPANNTGSCPTTAMWLLKCLTLMFLRSFPEAVTDPESGSYIRWRSCSTVDFPHPLGPTSAIVSLRGIFKLNPFSTCRPFSENEGNKYLNYKNKFEYIFLIILGIIAKVQLLFSNFWLSNSR